MQKKLAYIKKKQYFCVNLYMIVFYSTFPKQMNLNTKYYYSLRNGYLERIINDVQENEAINRR